ncbi:uncharacterized protein BDZ83DRAFT_574617 [Colletotrichum acutatum]|uniref:Uncharacterized protein n=1 Tax=Glomerella acutata TaxID=27357 RepID=A0AAD8UR28_GLOAC|nr:uncharacterized protein BDZ83DRAFT_574617 [Colletotrichum acutatum]KAK1726304.1 hypothetical protein BDZ83DRAFT_574617 [Colletotrichum acutatum]
MAPQQNTFAVIPDAPGRVGGPANRPPMTSKQAQKLYKQANKEPKRSKAEQRKWEKEKQEEIRKELEKERAAVKAKAARERKKAKEEEARENRRRAGQPLFDCRPSQDTIARFVRGNGTHKKRDSSGEPIPKPETASAALADIEPDTLASTAASKPPLQIESSEETKPSIASMAPPPRPTQITKSAMSPAQGATTSERQPSAEGVAPKPTDKDALTRQLLKPLFTAPEKAPALMASMGPPPRPAVKAKSRPFMMPKAALPTHQPPRHKIFKQKPSPQPSVQLKTEVSLPKELSYPKSALPKSSTAIPSPPVPSQKPRIEAVGDKAPTDISIPTIAPSPGVQSKQMLPPPRPSISQMPPPSTQAIVQDCFDDFFPTASQLAVELEEDFDGKHTMPRAVFGPKSNTHGAIAAAHSTPLDLMMSSQEVLDIESPAKAMTQLSSGGPVTNPASPLFEMDLGSIDWDDDLDDF